MPPTGVKSRKRARQYEHIKESEQKQGRSTARAKQIAAATVNKQRREAGETKGSRKRTTKKTRKAASRKTTSSRKSSSSRKSTSSRKKTSGRKKTSR
jgi:hypothetical protein